MVLFSNTAVYTTVTLPVVRYQIIKLYTETFLSFDLAEMVSKCVVNGTQVDFHCSNVDWWWIDYGSWMEATDDTDTLTVNAIPLMILIIPLLDFKQLILLASLMNITLQY